MTTPSGDRVGQNWLGWSGTACGKVCDESVDTSRQGEALSKIRYVSS